MLDDYNGMSTTHSFLCNKFKSYSVINAVFLENKMSARYQVSDVHYHFVYAFAHY